MVEEEEVRVEAEGEGVTAVTMGHVNTAWTGRTSTSMTCKGIQMYQTCDSMVQKRGFWINMYHKDKKVSLQTFLSDH